MVRKQLPKNVTHTGIGMGLGLLLGGLLGLLADNLVLFAGGGMIVGLAIGAAMDKRSQEY